VLADQQARITGSESQLNLPGFSAGNAFSFNFGDTVNLHTGDLVVTTTDVYLPGRNGLDLSVTRQYDSNIYLHWNQCPRAGESWTTTGCERINNLKSWCQSYCPGCNCNNLCDNCNPAHSYFESCCTGGGLSDQEVTSFKRPTWLGIGWSLDLGKIKDPTQLFVDKQVGGMHQFDYGVPEKGINSLTLVLNNAEKSIITPSYFESDALSSTGQRPWGSDLNGNLFYLYLNDLGIGVIVSGLGENVYVGYLDDFSPIIFKHDSIYDVYNPDDFPSAAIVTPGIPFSAEYHKDGTKYMFNHYVPFCGAFDDIPYINTPGNCVFQEQGSVSGYQDPYKYYKWAEDPYAGLYLTAIMDSVGNYMTINYSVEWRDSCPGGPGGTCYNGEACSGSYCYYGGDWPGTFWNFIHPYYIDKNEIDDDYVFDNSPFITEITDTLGRVIKFCTDDPGKTPQQCDNLLEGNPINGRLKWIKYPNYNGAPIYVVYYYTGTDDELLERVEVWANNLPPAGENQNLTTRYYYYDTISQFEPYKALKKIEYPTGASVEYSYQNTFNPSSGLFSTTNFYTYNYIFAGLGGGDSPDTAARWAVQKRTVIESDSADWYYKYASFHEGPSPPLFDVILTNTTIWDPLGNQEIHTFFPASQMPLRSGYG
jgi:hypothetical protein